MSAYQNFRSVVRGLDRHEKELEAVWKSSVCFARKTGGPRSAIRRSLVAYIIDPRGNLRVTYTDDTADDIARDIRHLLEQSPRVSANAHEDTDDAPSNLVMHGDLKIEKAWMRPATTGGTIGAFLSITANKRTRSSK